ncbi:uncharacterized protein [Physcomitrium patens]|uniref:uncharacterized protein isoform X2 n=1 Tax=Physcomitrium patens TaxID=3218 RepID=UPI000D151BFA|nr:uncharacterized protein LOC112279310 isoform X2 [Physcomitrium patens]|eukprot:XP_024369398.1 uncharacterized protein LOC112279310 isoform X2 [Physcomitrella patens]
MKGFSGHNQQQPGRCAYGVIAIPTQTIAVCSLAHCPPHLAPLKSCAAKGFKHVENLTGSNYFRGCHSSGTSMYTRKFWNLVKQYYSNKPNGINFEQLKVTNCFPQKTFDMMVDCVDGGEYFLPIKHVIGPGVACRCGGSCC